METFEWVFRKDIGGRKEQQDNGCVFVQDKVLLAAVADGLGGHRGVCFLGMILKKVG